MRRWDSILDGYVRECELRGLSEVSIEAKQRELERFGNWLKRRRPRPKIEEVNHEYLQEYIKTRTAFLAKASTTGVMSVIRCMGEYLLKEGYWDKNPLRWMKGPKLDHRSQLPGIIQKDQMRRLFSAAAQVQKPYNRHLYLAVLAILYGTGIRLGEIERLNLQDYDRDAGTLKIDGRKTSRQRFIPLPEFAVRCLEGYLPVRHNLLLSMDDNGQDALLLTSWGNRFIGVRVSRLLKRLASATGMPNLTPHQFRHTCATDLISDGVGLPEVQKILGHSHIDSTCRYSRIADPARIEAMKLHPINDILSQLYKEKNNDRS
jgi:site-specific recombinase XerD